jgi:hypothetical protein
MTSKYISKALSYLVGNNTDLIIGTIGYQKTFKYGKHNGVNGT